MWSSGRGIVAGSVVDRLFSPSHRLPSIAAKTGDARLSTLDDARTPTDPFPRSNMTSPMGSASTIWAEAMGWIRTIEQMKVDFSEIRSQLEKKQPTRLNLRAKKSTAHVTILNIVAIHNLKGYGDRSNISNGDSQIQSSIGHRQNLSHVSCRMNLKADTETKSCNRWESQRQAFALCFEFQFLSLGTLTMNLPTREPCPFEFKSSS